MNSKSRFSNKFRDVLTDMSCDHYDVFLSYSRADTALVIPLRDQLRRRGYRVFFDSQSIDPGDHWKARLDGAIRHSRSLVLCWSANTRSSDYVTFEYSRADALHKPIYPWLLDETPLPPWLEIQGILNLDAAEVAAKLGPLLGWALPRRRWVQGIAAVLFVTASSVGFWRGLNRPPPPPWVFEGEVTVSDKGRMPIPGVEVDLRTDNGVTRSTFTDSQGHYDFHLSQPQPKYVHIRFRKAGFEAENPINVPTGKSCDMALLPLP